MSDVNFCSLIETACRANGARPAIRDRSGSVYSFDHIFYAVQSLATALLDRGVERGDFVANYMDDQATSLVMGLALFKIGASLVITRGGAEAKDGGHPVRFFVVPPNSMLTGPLILRFDQSWLAPAAGYVPMRPPGVIICSSSGTTGEPKLQAATHAVLKERIDQETSIRGYPTGGVLIGNNIRSFFGFRLALATLLAGREQTYTDRKPNAVIADAVAAGVTRAYLTPIVLKELLTAYDRAGGALGRLTFDEIFSSGAATSYDLAQKAEAAFGGQVYTAYGSSETGYIAETRVVPPTPDGGQVVGRIRPMFGYRFEDENRMPTTPDAGGELVVRVPPEMRKSAYLNGEGPYSEDGWVHTGDVARIDADGNLVLTGRRADFVNIGGTKRAAAVFERLAMANPAVADAAAVAMPNAAGYDDLCMVLVVAEGAHRETVMEHLRKAVAPVAKGALINIYWRTSLPFVDNGKHDKRAIVGVIRSSLPDDRIVSR